MAGFHGRVACRFDRSLALAASAVSRKVRSLFAGATDCLQSVPLVRHTD